MLRAKQMGRVPRNERGKKRGSQCFAGLPEVVKETGQQQRPQQSKLNQHLTLIASRFSPSLASSPVLSLSQLTTGNNKTHTHTRMALFFSDACNVLLPLLLFYYLLPESYSLLAPTLLDLYLTQRSRKRLLTHGTLRDTKQQPSAAPPHFLPLPLLILPLLPLLLLLLKHSNTQADTFY